MKNACGKTTKQVLSLLMGKFKKKRKQTKTQRAKVGSDERRGVSLDGKTGGKRRDRHYFEKKFGLGP